MTFNEFYVELNDILNFRFNLGEKVEYSRVFKKILWSLFERLRPKAIAIEERKDLDAIKVEELVGSLQTNESSLSQAKKDKSITLKTVKKKKTKVTLLMKKT